MKVSLDAFISMVRHKTRGNAWVLEPKFASLYIRYGPKYISATLQHEPVKHDDVLDIANVNVAKEYRRTGVFTALVARLRQTYPGMSLYVENASPEFAPLLKKLGFTEVLYDSFFLEGDKANHQHSTR